MCQLHFCCSIKTILLFTAGYESMFSMVFHPDTVILSFLCFMTVLQAPTSGLSQDINYWWEIEFALLKLLSTLKRSSSIIGLLSCAFGRVAVSSWCGLLLASPESGTPDWDTHRREMGVDASADEQRGTVVHQERGRRLESPGTARSDSFMEPEAFSFAPAMWAKQMHS